MSNYSTNLTEKQWKVIKNIVEPQERRRKKSLREILNSIFISKSGSQWRMFPSDFAPWQTVYYYFRKWKLEGVWKELMDVLHGMARKSVGKQESPSLGIIDSRSVKISHHVDTDRGIDGNKKIKRRKEHIVVDTLKLPMAIDGGYQGDLATWTKNKFGWELEVVLRPKETPKKFNVIPKRRIVERTFSWLENYRRLTIGYEFLTDTAEAMVTVVFIQILLKRVS